MTTVKRKTFLAMMPMMYLTNRHIPESCVKCERNLGSVS